MCNSPLQTPVRRPASQQAATAVFQLPGAPGMQREPRRAAAQACVREQRALSVPKKQPGGDFHPIGPNATAAGGVRLGLRREPRDGALAWQHRKDPLLWRYYVVLSPTAPEHPCVLPQGRGQKQTERWKQGEKEHRREKQDETRRGEHTQKNDMLTVVKGKEI